MSQDRDVALRRSIGRAASAHQAAERATTNAAVKIVAALARGGAGGGGPELVELAKRSESLTAEVTDLGLRIRALQREEMHPEVEHDHGELSSRAEALLKAGQGLCEAGDELQAAA